MNADGPTLNDILRLAIGCALTVANALGCGFLEKDYEYALPDDLRQAGVTVAQEIASSLCSSQ